MKPQAGAIPVILTTVLGILCCTGGLWIHAKAELAQVLLRHAWSRTVRLHRLVKPWPWADIVPAARLRVPRHGQDLIILQGQSGAALAFGPGMLRQGVRPGRPGACILAGHRDTSFSFLRRIRPGDTLQLEDDQGTTWFYRVTGTEILQADELIFGHDPVPHLILITCYPFESLLPGTRQRYVVTAEIIPAAERIPLQQEKKYETLRTSQMI
jgi:sortase A